MTTFAALLLALIPPPPATVADVSWNTLTLKPGDKVVVISVDGRILKGRLAAQAADAVTVQMSAANFDIARNDVAVIRAAGPAGDFHTIYAPWENLSQLPAGQRIRVIRKNLTQVDGTLAASTDDMITLAQGNKKVVVPRDRIRKVRVLLKSNAETGAKIGATVGLLAVLAAVVAATAQSGSSSADFSGVLEATTLGGGALGGGIASLFDQYQTIYFSPR